jgi:hypothetical protein
LEKFIGLDDSYIWDCKIKGNNIVYALNSKTNYWGYDLYNYNIESGKTKELTKISFPEDSFADGFPVNLVFLDENTLVYNTVVNNSYGVVEKIDLTSFEKSVIFEKMWQDVISDSGKYIILHDVSNFNNDFIEHTWLYELPTKMMLEEMQMAGNRT